MNNLLAMGSNLQALLDGKKTYLIGAAMCLSGLAGMLNELSNLHGLMSMWALVQNGANDPGLKMLLMGCATMSGRSAIQKATDAAAPAAPSA